MKKMAYVVCCGSLWVANYNFSILTDGSLIDAQLSYLFDDAKLIDNFNVASEVANSLSGTVKAIYIDGLDRGDD